MCGVKQNVHPGQFLLSNPSIPHSAIADSFLKLLLLLKDCVSASGVFILITYSTLNPQQSGFSPQPSLANIAMTPFRNLK